MEHFKEMNAGDMAKVVASSKGNGAKYHLVEYKPFFVVIDNYRTVLVARYHHSQNITEIRVSIKDYFELRHLCSTFRVGGTTQAACACRAHGGVF